MFQYVSLLVVLFPLLREQHSISSIQFYECLLTQCLWDCWVPHSQGGSEDHRLQQGGSEDHIVSYLNNMIMCLFPLLREQLSISSKQYCECLVDSISVGLLGPTFARRVRRPQVTARRIRRSKGVLNGHYGHSIILVLIQYYVCLKQCPFNSYMCLVLNSKNY